MGAAKNLSAFWALMQKLGFSVGLSLFFRAQDFIFTPTSYIYVAPTCSELSKLWACFLFILQGDGSNPSPSITPLCAASYL